MSQLIFIFNNSLPRKFKHSVLPLTLSNFKRESTFIYDLIFVNRQSFKHHKIEGNNSKAQASYYTYNEKRNAYAVNLQLKNFLKNYKYEKLINNFKEFNNYNNKNIEKTKHANTLFIKNNPQIGFPNIKEQKLNKKINTLHTFLGESTNTNHNIDSFNLLKQAACVARLLKYYQFFFKQTFVFSTTSNFIFLKKIHQLNTLHVLETKSKTKVVALKQNYRTYSYLQTLLAKYLETTNNTKNTLNYDSNCASYKMFLQKQALYNFMTNMSFFGNVSIKAFFFRSTSKNILLNQQVLNTEQHFLFNKINNKSFLGYWLIPITGFALMTSNIFYNTNIIMSFHNSYYNHVLYLKTLPINMVQTNNVISQNILSCKTKLYNKKNLNIIDLNFFKQNEFLPFSYQYNQSLIIKKTFNNLYSFIKAKTTLSKTTRIIPIIQKIVDFNLSHTFVPTNVETLLVTSNFKQKKIIKKVDNYFQSSNTLIPLNILCTLNNNVKWLYKNSIFKKNIYEYNLIKLGINFVPLGNAFPPIGGQQSSIKPFFILNSDNKFQNYKVSIYSDKLNKFFEITNIFTHFKNSEAYFKNMLYLSTINPLYSNLKLNNNVCFIKNKKALKLLKNKILKLTKTKRKIYNNYTLPSGFPKETTNIQTMFFDKTPYGDSNMFLFDSNGKKNISKLYKTTYSDKIILKHKPFDSYKESLNLLNLNLKHNTSLICCKNILHKYNKLCKLKLILNLNNIQNKNQILFNYFLIYSKFFYTKKLLKLKLNLIKSIIDLSKNKINNNFKSYDFNNKLTKPIFFNKCPNLKMISTRFKFNQNLSNSVLSIYLMPSFYKDYKITQLSINKIIQTRKLCDYTQLSFKTNIYNKTKSFKYYKLNGVIPEGEVQQKFNLNHGVKTYFLTFSPKYNINSLSILFKHQKMFKNKTEIEKQKLQIQKKRKAKKQRLETRRQKKRTRFFPRPIWLRSRMFLNFINQRQLSLANATLKKDKNKGSTMIVLTKKNKVFKNLFLRKINSNLNRLTQVVPSREHIHYIMKKFIISKNKINNKKNIQKFLKTSRSLKDSLNKSKTFYLNLNAPIKRHNKKENYKQKKLRDIKMNIGSIKANYINFKNQKTNNSPSTTEKEKDKNTIFRDFWIWAYNSTLTNTISQKLWWFLPNNTSLFLNSFFSDFRKNQKFSISRSNKNFINTTKQIKHIFAITRINWALYKTNSNSFTDYNKRYNLWGAQKLRNQSKNNKTKYLEKQFIDFFNKKIFLNKNLNAFYKKISNKLSQKTQKLNYLTSYSYNSVYYHSFKTKNIKIFNNFFWSNLKIQTLVKNTYVLEKQQDPYLVFTTEPNFLKKVLNLINNFKFVEKTSKVSHNIYFQSNFVSFLIISCLILLHLCVLISLVSISQVRCFVKFHLILVYKLSNVYTNILAYVSNIVKLRQNNILLKHKKSNFLINTNASKVKTNLLLLKENQNRLLTFFSFNLLKKEFKNKPNVILNKSKVFKLKTEKFDQSNNINKIIFFITNNLNIIYSKINIISLKSDFLKRSVVTKSQHRYRVVKTFINLENKTTTFRKSIFMSYKIKQGIYYFKKLTNFKTNNTINFFKKTISNTCFYLIDFFQSSVRTISNFFEKPAEYTTTWIAFGFLVEWSSDLITIMPESVDIYIWNVFYKISREKNIQFILNSYYDLLTLFCGFYTNSQLNLSGNSNVNVNINTFPFLLTISYLIQSRIKHLFDILMETISQPDTDLITRQKKGTLFWDIWADFLVTTADYYNVNIAALSTIKAEQNGLIENISNDFGTLINPKEIKKNYNIKNKNFYNEIQTPQSRSNKKNFNKYGLKNNLLVSDLSSVTYNKQKNFFIKKYFMDQIKDFTKKEKMSLNPFLEKLVWPNIIFGKQKTTDLLDNISSKLSAYTTQESKLESILANLNRWSINQYITYQSWHSHNGTNNANGDLFIDYHPPKSFSHISTIKYNNILQQPIGTMVCQIYSGIFNQQISKNLLLVNTKTKKKQVSGASPVTDYNTLLIQALAGETELKIVTDNAHRYALVNRGFAIGIKLLRDVFDAIALNTPCIFLLEDIHTIGERRPMLISDSGGTLADDIGDIQLDFFGSQRDEIHEKNQVVYQLTRHAITHYKKPFRGDYSHCLTPDHDVLTTNGWIPINQVTTDHIVATFNYKTGELEYQKPTKVYHYNHQGPLYHVKNEQIDLVTTLNHRMLVQNGHIDGNSLTNYNLVPAKDIIGKCVKYLKTANWNKEEYQFVLPSVTLYLNCIEQSKIVDMEAWLTFFGLWMAEGCVTKNSPRYEVIITQKNKNVAEIIQEVIQKLGYTYTKSKFNFRVHNKQLYKYLEPLSVGAPQKQLPSWVWELSQKQARVLLEGMFLGDGSFCSSGKTRVYYTSSVLLADDVMRLALHAGWSGNKNLSVLKGTFKYIDDRKITAKYDNWSISIIQKRNNPTVNHSHSTKQGFQIEELIEYEGSVHCLSVPNETFYVRRNNLPVWTGNSIPTNLYLTDLFLKLPTQSISNLSLVENHNLTIKNKIKNQNFLKFFSSLKISYINIIKQTKKKFAPPSTSPFSVLLLKEEKKLRPNKIVEELPWTSLPGEQLSTKPRASYSVRAKVALLAELSLSNMSAKLDMITDLLVIIDSVRSNKGFVVFATTNFPHILDPALRRPGRLDETICLPDFSNHINLNYEIIKSIHLKNYQMFCTPVLKNVSMGLPSAKYFKNSSSNLMFDSNYALVLNNISNYKKKNFIINQHFSLLGSYLNSSQTETTIIPQDNNQLHSTFTTQTLKKKLKNKEIAYYEVGKNLLLFYLKKLYMRTDYLNLKYSLFDNKIFGTTENLNLKNINKVSLYSSKNQIILQLMVVFGGKISQLLSHKKLINTVTLKSKKTMFPQRGQTTNLVKSEMSTLFETILSQILFNLKNECISLEITPNENLSITTSMLLSILHKRYLYKKNLIVPKLLSFTDGNVLEEPPSPPFSSLLIPAKRFENYKRIFQDSLVSNKMGQRKAQISFIEKLQYQIQLIKIKELKNIFSDAQKSRKTTQNIIQQNQLNQFGNLISIPDETLVQTTTNINWFYQNRILKRHGYYLTNQWWNGQLSEHNTETIFLSDIDWRSSFIKNKQISTKFKQKNNSDGLDILLDFPDTDQYYNPRRRRWLLNKGYWSFWFNFDKVYSEEILFTWIVESIIQTYKFLHNNTELLDFIANKFIRLNYYLVKTKVVYDKTTYPKTDLILQRNFSQNLNKNLVKTITKTEINFLKKLILTNSSQRF